MLKVNSKVDTLALTYMYIEVKFVHTSNSLNKYACCHYPSAEYILHVLHIYLQKIIFKIRIKYDDLDDSFLLFQNFILKLL